MLVFKQLFTFLKCAVQFQLGGDATILFRILSQGGFVEHLSWTSRAQQSVTKFISMIVINLGTPKVAAKHVLLFKKQV
jgi:hypothetical protein